MQNDQEPQATQWQEEGTTTRPLILDSSDPDRVRRVFTHGREREERRRQGLPLGVETPFPQLNEHFGGGFQPGQTYIIGAPPGAGKSALALLLARHVVRNGGRALYLAYEVGPDQSRARALFDIANLKANDYLAGRFDPDDLERHFEALEEETAGIAFVDATQKPRPTAETIFRACELVKGNDPYRFVLIVDYLQMAARFAIDEKKEREMRGRVAQFSADLSHIARTLKVAVVALSSVPRSAYKDATGLGGFKEAGDIESDADGALMIGPRWDGEGDAWEKVDKCEIKPLWLHILKARHGKRGSIPLNFEGAYMRFSEGNRGEKTS